MSDAARDQAVKNVDARHGYTCEFSSSPERHRQEYDEEEARLLALRPDAHLEWCKCQRMCGGDQ